MRFMTNFVLALVLPAFVPAEPFPPLATVGHTAEVATWRECPSPRIVDGDTIRCGSERVRLIAIDAPEMNGCPRGRTCVAGNPVASSQSLKQGVRSGPVRYMMVKRDRYGRAVAVVKAGDLDLSCWQIQRGHAEYVAKWDEGGLVAQAC